VVVVVSSSGPFPSFLSDFDTTTTLPATPSPLLSCHELLLLLPPSPSVIFLLVRDGGVVIGITAVWLQKDPVFLPELLLVLLVLVLVLLVLELLLLVLLELVLLGFQGGRRQQVGGAAVSTTPKGSTRLHSSRRQRVGSRQGK
jgi:hypothetical protein